MQNPRRRPIILVVDDDEAVCQLLMDVFQDTGHIVECATTAEGAWEIASVTTVLAAFVDVLLGPGENGVGLAARLRQCAIPVILMTGSLEWQRRLEEDGEGAVLWKPFRLDELHRTLARVIQKDASNAGRTRDRQAQ